MKCKSVVFLILIMLIASGVSAFALTTGEKYDAGDITNLQTFFTERYGATTEDWQLNGYTISADGIYMVFEVYRTVFTAPATDSTANEHYIAWYTMDQAGQANSYYASLAVEPYVTTILDRTELVEIDAEKVVINEQADIKALYPSYMIVYSINGQYLLTDGVSYILVRSSVEADPLNRRPSGHLATGPDAFDLNSSSFGGSVISAFSFKPEEFGDGITFSHKNAKSLFSMTVKSEAKIVFQLRDREGRLYPISGATYSSADNGYVATMKADESKTFGWYGTDNAGYHVAGSLTEPATIMLDLNVRATTTDTNADGSAKATDHADMRFAYIVQHGDNAHNGNYDGNSSSELPPTEDQAPTGPDAFDLNSSSFGGSVISAFSFKPEEFGDGITFNHKNAKSLFSMTVKYEAKIVFQLRDQEGRLYPISGTTYSAADNGYVATMKADESKTFGWYGTDNAGYHVAGSLTEPATIMLDLNVRATTTDTNADGSAKATDHADMRFAYIVQHGDNAHNGNYDGNSSSELPPTEDQAPTGPDAFDLNSSSFGGSVISAFSFKPEEFGDGITFNHKNAKSLFSMTVKYEAKIVFQLRDQEGRLYPISGTTYSAADNGYVATMKADESKTFGWYGTDNAGYHVAGSLTEPATIMLDLNVRATTTDTNADGSAKATDHANMRFAYIVQHGANAHNDNYSDSSNNISSNSSSFTPSATEGPITTGFDDFDLKYSNFGGSVISAFSFKPEGFGDGVTFSHKNAKSLFSMTVKSEAKVIIQLRDQDGRLYPISGATYSSADNGYVVTMKADESKTFGWYGTDGAGYHAAGSLAKPATIMLDLNVWATTTDTNADGSAKATDHADMRFDYIVQHGANAHNGNYSSNSSPKTGDVRMTYLTLTFLVILAGAAFVSVHKLRTNA